MGSHGGLPRAFAAVHPRFASPKVGTIMTGLAGAVVYVVMNFLSHGYVIVDAVSSCGLMIAFAPHWHVGGVFLIGAGAFACGLLAMAVWSRLSPGFFAGRLAQPEEAPEGATEPVTA